MGEPTQHKKIKLTPGNRRQKGRRSEPKNRRVELNNPKYKYTFKDPRVGEMQVLNSDRAWWAEEIQGPIKLQKLVDAYCFYYTDDEACSYAGISLMQLEYFQKLHPEFYGIKHLCKAQPDMHAKKKIVEAAGKDVNWAAWWISRTQKETFSTRTESTGADGRDLFDGVSEKLRALTESLANESATNKKHTDLPDADGDDAGSQGDRDETGAAELSD
jgi:hypothetical protein